MNPRLIGIAAATIVAVQVMSMFLPQVHEVRDRRHGNYDVEQLRSTAYVGAVVAFTVGVMVAVAARNPLPVISSMVAVGFIVGIYEWAIRNPVGV